MAACCYWPPCSVDIPFCRRCSPMPAIRDGNSNKRSRTSCPASRHRSLNAPIRPRDLFTYQNAGSWSVPLHGSTAVEGSPKTGRTSIARAWHSCALPQFASCCESFAIPANVSGQTLRHPSALTRRPKPHCGCNFARIRFRQDRLREIWTPSAVTRGRAGRCNLFCFISATFSSFDATVSRVGTRDCVCA
jgi:hypothetical protein